MAHRAHCEDQHHLGVLFDEPAAVVGLEPGAEEQLARAHPIEPFIDENLSANGERRRPSCEEVGQHQRVQDPAGTPFFLFAIAASLAAPVGSRPVEASAVAQEHPQGWELEVDVARRYVARVPAFATLVLCFAVVAAAACPVPSTAVPGGEEGEEGDGGDANGEGEGEAVGCLPDEDTGFPAPLGTRTASVGSLSTFDVAAWNLKRFGSTDESDPRQAEFVADVITSLDLDLVGVQEVENETRWNELLARLPEHDGILQPSSGRAEGFDQRTGFLYRCGRLTPGPAVQLFSGNFNFPRAPMQVEFRYADDDDVVDFLAIVVHFKAFEDSESNERRNAAFRLLEAYVDSIVNSASAPEKIVILGDFNERLESQNGQENWAPFLDGSKYVVHTQPLSDRGEASFVSSSGGLIDHIVTTRAFDDEVGVGTIVIPRVDQDVPNYRDDVSDHRPVALILRGLD
jgi:endonuclease/exonuclease/phosphatase family metal-dependent hydrolase